MTIFPQPIDAVIDLIDSTLHNMKLVRFPYLSIKEGLKILQNYFFLRDQVWTIPLIELFYLLGAGEIVQHFVVDVGEWVGDRGLFYAGPVTLRGDSF